MNNSIRHFAEKSINIFEKLEENFYKNPKDFYSYATGITEELHKLGLMMIKESLEDMNQMLIDSGVRKADWIIEKHSDKKLVTSLGTVSFKKTLFTNRKTQESHYLLDQILGMESHERMTEDAEVRMFQEAVQTSYRRGGEETSLTDSVSKQTVKNKIHKLRFPENKEIVEKKKNVEYLYIDADEDHISLQFREKKGDLIQSENGNKNNGMITKLVYVYEGVEPVAPKSKRHRLINPYYFSENYKSNEELWKTVWSYIQAHYEVDKIKKIYINGDGASWIRAGKTYIEKSKFVLDEFHLSKYITKMTSHMKDSIDDAKTEIYTAIRRKTKKDFLEIVERLRDALPNDTGEKRLTESSQYILNNWMAARTRVLHRDAIMGCSAEGHVSHILSSRMSSRPMGWSIVGANKMSELRVYQYNKRDMLELVRYQKEEVPVAAGAEELIYNIRDLLNSEKKRTGNKGKYIELMQHRASNQLQKKVMFQYHIWDL